MVKIREDFDGVVHVAVGSVKRVLSAGDVVPEGARVGGHLTDSGEDVGPVALDAPSVSSVESVTEQDPLNDADAALAAELGIDGSPDWVRGYLACAADLAGDPEAPGDGTAPVEGEFNPADVSMPEVHAYLAAHPDDVERVLELERGGKARSGILNAYGAAKVEDVL